MSESKANWKKPFFTIAIGQAISLIGSAAVQFALIWWIANKTNSAMMLGLSGLAAFVPMTVLSPLAGVLADKYNRKAICIASDLFLGLVATVFGILMWIYDMPVWAALVIIFLRGVGGTFHQPSMQAMIPQLVPSEELVRANGWTQMLQSGSFMLGPVIGAAMYAAFPMPVILFTDMIGAIFACTALAMVHVPKLVHNKNKEHEPFWQNFKQGVQVYLDDKSLLRLAVAHTLCMLFFLPLSSFYPLMTSGYFKASAWHGSAVELAYALGMLISAMLFGSILHVKNKLGTAYLGLMGLGVTSVICGVLPPHMWAWWVFMVACGLMGASGNINGIPMMAYMQKTIAPEKMGRAFSVFALTASLTMPLGLLLAGPVAEKIGVHIWFFISGVGICSITLVFWLLHNRAVRKGIHTLQ